MCKEVRLSIPFVGGITVIYTQAEIEQKKIAMKAQYVVVKKHTCSAIAKAARFSSGLLGKLANKVEKKQVARVQLLLKA